MSTEDEAGIAMELTRDLSLHLLHHNREVALTALQAISAVVLGELKVPITFFADRLRSADQRLRGRPTPPAREMLARRLHLQHCVSLASQLERPIERTPWDTLDELQREAWRAAAAVAEQPEPVRAACIHCKQDVAEISDVGAIVHHSMTCSESPVVRELERSRAIVAQAQLIARRWDTQDGVNGAEIDTLRDIVFDRPSEADDTERDYDPDEDRSPDSNDPDDEDIRF